MTPLSSGGVSEEGRAAPAEPPGAPSRGAARLRAVLRWVAAQLPPSTWLALESHSLEWGIQAARLLLVGSYVGFASFAAGWEEVRSVVHGMGAVMLAYTAWFIVLLSLRRTRTVAVLGAVLDPLTVAVAVLASAAAMRDTAGPPTGLVGPGTAAPLVPAVAATVLRLRPLPGIVLGVVGSGSVGAAAALLGHTGAGATLAVPRALGMAAVGLSIAGVSWPIQRVREQLQVSVTEKLQLVSTVAHELRGPLTAVRTHLELLLDGAAGEMAEQQRRLVQGAARSTARMEQMVTALAQVERAERADIPLEREAMDLAAVAAEVKEAMEPVAAERDIAIELADFEGLAHAWADRQSVEQVLSNLLSNAVKFSLAGGSVTLRGYARAREVGMSVVDRGMGIPEEDQRHVFDRFHRGADPRKRRIRGTGLGLYVSRSLVERNGGRMWFTTAPDAGSTFTFVLPAAGPGTVAQAAGRQPDDR